VINSNLPRILTVSVFGSKAIERSIQNRYICWLPMLCLTPPTEGFALGDLRKIVPGCQWMARVPNAVEILRKLQLPVHER